MSVTDLQRVLGQHYRVEREIGAGGMATVYLAQDPKHDRRVAIKVLRPELAAIVGGERFLKEIRTTANLQHPHILPLHDSGDADGTIYYVMPYVEGESLRQRLMREKQLPVDEAVRIAREVAGGLDYAHRHGVVHRDIKPENILLHDGQALVADFGIALAVSRSDGGARMTETGMSLGTPNYMSPEQAMGEREITPKSDVYALGCVLYEMLVGEPPFTGPTPQAVIARVLTDDPRSLTLQRRSIPPHVEAAVLTALSKLPADRFASAAQFSEALAGRSTAASLPAQPVASRAGARPARYALLGAVALTLLLTGAGVGRLMAPRARGVGQPARLSVRIAGDHRLTGAPVGTVALSPDGSSIIYVAEGARGIQLFLRRLDDLVATPLAGTEGAVSPSFAPDGEWIDFISGSGYRRVPASGGSSVSSGIGRNISFFNFFLRVSSEEFLVTGELGALGRLRASGVFELIARPDSAANESALLPMDMLPDGRVLVLAQSQGLTGSIWIVDPDNGKRQLVSRSLATMAAYRDGYIAWVLPTGALVAAPWDQRRGEIGGAAHVLAPNVRVTPGAPPQVAFSRSGSLVYVAAQPSDLVRVERSGREEVIGGRSRRFHNPRVSPDGGRIAVDVTDELRDVWLLHIRDGSFTRLTFDNDGHDPTWVPDGRSVLYATARANVIGIHRRRADGSGAADSILHDGPLLSAHTVGADGTHALAVRATERGDFDIVLVRLGAGARAEPLLVSGFGESHPALSPDGRWLAYVSDESGRSEVYVRPLGAAAGRIVVSHNGGTEPVWSRSGREIFYRDLEGPSLLAATLETRPELRVTSRTRLFDVGDYESAAPHANFDVTPDGKFVFVRNARASELIIIQNWTELVRRRTGAR